MIHDSTEYQVLEELPASYKIEFAGALTSIIFWVSIHPENKTIWDLRVIFWVSIHPENKTIWDLRVIFWVSPEIKIILI